MKGVKEQTLLDVNTVRAVRNNSWKSDSSLAGVGQCTEHQPVHRRVASWMV